VQKDGSWNTSGLTLDLTSLEQGKISVTASVADKAGNTASDSINNDVLDTRPPSPSPMMAVAATVYSTRAKRQVRQSAAAPPVWKQARLSP
jgi:hypothetical protein